MWTMVVEVEVGVSMNGGKYMRQLPPISFHHSISGKIWGEKRKGPLPAAQLRQYSGMGNGHPLSSQGTQCGSYSEGTT